jgi:alpha-tubulin suppressor-like RCC1 family protein
VYTFGLGVFGQLGHGVSSDERFPRRIEALVPAEEEGFESAGERIVQIACGSHHTLALGVSGTVWTWGSAEYGQQGGTNAYEDWATGTLPAHDQRHDTHHRTRD